MQFTHLHVHTEYSLLDGSARIKELIKTAKSLGMAALAITDHGTMFGVIEFYKEALKNNIKPIIGCEVYTAKRRMTDKDGTKDKKSGHLILLAKNNLGYKNLIKIVSKAYTEGFYYKPRIDYECLSQYSEGLIVLSGCLAGNVQQRLLDDDYEGAKKEALTLMALFGEGNFYLELQNQGIEEEIKVNQMLIKMSKEINVPLVATNDVHYTKKEDASVHEVLLCIQTGKTLDDTDRMRFPTEEFYLKSQEEMSEIFLNIPEAIENSNIIADQCDVSFDFNNQYLPNYISPENYTNESYLRKLCLDGLNKKYEKVEEHLIERLEYELNTISKMGYIEYFLIVWDFIDYAKSNNIMVGPGRGSAAGSLVAYTLDITNIDPIKYHLIFERFLNPERVTMPDIDIDFCYERRQEVIDYVIEKYGKEKVAQIITFGRMKARAAIRDVGRAINMPYSEVDTVAKMIPMDLGITIDKALEMNQELKIKYDTQENIKYLIDTAIAVEGLPRHASTHAAGVVIGKDAIDEYVPLYLQDRGVSTQFTMTTLEELGLLKMDFLGLRNLTVIRDALEIIEDQHHVKLNMQKLSYDDKKVFDLITKGDTLGVFQLESAGMQQFMKELKPDCFEDIIAGISLYRPGPMDSIPKYIKNKNNTQNIEYLHEKLEPILDVTYGCLVYQEQVMQLVRELAGYTFGRSDLVRRAMSKKKMDVMEQEREYFINGKLDESGEVEIEGCVRNGVSPEIANKIYDEMIDFAKYAFNKSHAAAYAVLAYETAYLKTYYPVEFMAALMTSIMGDSAKIAKYIKDCKAMKIEVLAPDINKSLAKFSVHQNKIQFGLMAVKNVGLNVINAIIDARENKGEIKNIFEFYDKVDIHQMNKRAIESLIKAGALDHLGGNRAQFLSIYERLLDNAQQSMRKSLAGQITLFQSFESEMTPLMNLKLPDINEFQKNIVLAMEKEITGVYISGHPLAEYEKEMKQASSIATDEIAESLDENDHKVYDGMKVIMSGIITRKQNKITKNNNMMAFATLEDLYGEIDVVVFPKVFDACKSFLNEDAMVVVSGRLSFKEEEMPGILADSIRPLISQKIDNVSNVNKSGEKKMYIKIGEKMDIASVMANIKKILAGGNGQIPVYVYLEGEKKKMRADKNLWVNKDDSSIGRLKEMLGEKNVKMI